MIIRRERPNDADQIRRVHSVAFRRPNAPSEEPVEAALVDELRASTDWLPRLSLVALSGDSLIGHVVCSRAELGPGHRPVLGLGPLGVQPDHQGGGVGQALVHAVLGSADALDESLVGLVGAPSYYHRFGFEPAQRRGVDPPEATWGDHFQVRTLAAYEPTLSGAFRYATAFEGLPPR